MPTFRVRKQDGTEQTVQALRVVTDVVEVMFEERNAGEWQPILCVPAAEVDRVQQRLNQPDGSWLWARVEPSRRSAVRQYQR